MRIAFLTTKKALDGIGGARTVLKNWTELAEKCGYIIEVITPNSAKEHAGLAKKLSVADCLVALHLWDFSPEQLKEIFGLSGKLIYRLGDEFPKIRKCRVKCRVLLYNSHLLLSSCQNRIEAHESHFFPHWLKAKRRDIDFNKNPLSFLFAGRSVQKKGLGLLLESWSLFKRYCPESNCELHVFTDSNAVSQFKEFSSQSEMVNLRISLYLNKPNEYIIEKLPKIGAVLFPSLKHCQTTSNDGFPNIIAEAISEGVPIIGNFYSGAFEFTDSNNSIAVNSDLPTDWAYFLINSKLILQTLHESSHQPSRIIFSENEAIQKLKQVVEKRPVKKIRSLISDRFDKNLETKEQVLSWLTRIIDASDYILKNARHIATSKRDSTYYQILERSLVGEFLLYKNRMPNNFKTKTEELINAVIPRTKLSMIGGVIGLLNAIDPLNTVFNSTQINKFYERSMGEYTPLNNFLLFKWVQQIHLPNHNPDEYINEIESYLYRDGLFFDGKHKAVDLYNNWMFHLYLPQIFKRINRCPNYYNEAFNEFSKDTFYRFFDPSGYPLFFGRSISYRTAILSPVLNIIDIQNECSLSMVKAFKATINLFYRSVGHIGMLIPGLYGIHRSESYLNIGSTLWCLWGFLPLLLDANHDFWQRFEKVNVSINDYWWGLIDESITYNDEAGISPTMKKKIRNQFLYNGSYSTSLELQGFPGSNVTWPSLKKHEFR